VRVGTLRGILRDCRLTADEFLGLLDLRPRATPYLAAAINRAMVAIPDFADSVAQRTPSEVNAAELKLIMKVSPALNEVNLGFHLVRAR
jgi:hypothetical protein